MKHLRTVFVAAALMAMPTYAPTYAQDTGPGLEETLDWVGSKLMGENIVSFYSYEDCGIGIVNKGFYKGTIYYEGYSKAVFDSSALRQLAFSEISKADFKDGSHYGMALSNAFFVNMGRVESVSVKQVTLDVEYIKGAFNSSTVAVIELGLPNSSFLVGNMFVDNADAQLSQRIAAGDGLNRPDGGKVIGDENIPQNSPRIWMATSIELAPRIAKALEHAASICRARTADEPF